MAAALLRSLAPLTRLDRYILRQITAALVAVTLALVALIWLTQSLRFVELIVNRGLSPFVFLRLTVLLVPSFVAVILPITIFVVVQFVYQRLAGDRELTVMRAAGQSPFRPRQADAPSGYRGRRDFASGSISGSCRQASPPSASISSKSATASPPSSPGGRFHPDFQQPHRLCPQARPGRHAARHSGG